MKEKTKIIKKTPEYDIIQWQYNGKYWCTFRIWKDTGLMEIRADEAFAKSNGYESVESYFKDCCNYEALMRLNRRLPEWLRIDGSGNITYLANRGRL